MLTKISIQLLTKKLVVKINAIKFSLLKFETVRAGELDGCGRPFFLQIQPQLDQATKHQDIIVKYLKHTGYSNT